MTPLDRTAGITDYRIRVLTIASKCHHIGPPEATHGMEWSLEGSMSPLFMRVVAVG